MSDPPEMEGGAAELTRRLAALEDSAFVEFHRIYFDRLYRLALILSRGNASDAADTVQDIFVRVARYAKPFKTDEAFWSWLTVLARSAARDSGRRSQRRRSMHKRFQEFILPHATPELSRNDSLRDHLAESLESLPAPDRHLLEAKYVDGRSTRELAEKLGTTVKSIESRLGRLRISLKTSIISKKRKS